MTAQAVFGIDITASDKTAKGKKSAEKSLGQISNKLGTIERKAAEQTERSVGSSGRRVAKTFSQVEQAAARALGGRSITGGLADRLGSARSAASALGSGLGEASAAGGVLEGAMAGVAVAGAATIGVLAAAAYAAFKLADGWAKGAASIGRTAEILGIGTKALQEFTLAAERAGVDRGTAGAALGGLTQTLNDARYGRNNDALAVLGRLGVSLKTKSDGTADVEAMLPQIADAIGKQNSSGRRTAARILGIPEAALPAFSQGGAALSQDMRRAGQEGAVIDDEGIATGKKIARRDTIGAQMVERGTNAASRMVAEGVDTVGTAVISTARSMSRSSQTNERAADKIDRAGGTLERAALRIERAAGAGVIHTRSETIDAVRRAARVVGVDPNALLSVAAHESGLNPSIKAKTSSATGLFQFLDKTWLSMVGQHGAQYGIGWAQAAVKGGKAGRGSTTRSQILALRNDPYLSSVMGAELMKANNAALRPILGRDATAGENYMAHFLGTGGARKFFREEQRNPAAGAAGLFPEQARANRSVFYGRDGHERSLQEVANLMASFVERPVKIQLELSGVPTGAKVTARAGPSTNPAISHAMHH